MEVRPHLPYTLIIKCTAEQTVISDLNFNSNAEKLEHIEYFTVRLFIIDSFVEGAVSEGVIQLDLRKCTQPLF